MCTALMLVLLPTTAMGDDDTLAGFLRRQGLDSLLVEHLRGVVADGDLDARRAAAEELADIYAEQLESVRSAEERARLESVSQELLRSVPDSDSLGLRVQLAKARYLPAERIAERVRVRANEAGEEVGAATTLLDVRDDFTRIALRAARRVTTLEQAVERGGDRKKLQPQLDEARRLRSVSYYYAGWAGYYHAFLTGNRRDADDAKLAFGWILGSFGEEPSLDQLSRGLLVYEHVARAAIGVAMCESLLGEHSAALNWLSAVAASEDISASVRSGILSWRMATLTNAARWHDLTLFVERAREPTRDGEPRRLTGAEARLLAVLSLDSLRGASREDPDRERMLLRLTEWALADLVASGELSHVVELVETYGTLPLVGDGFVPLYVRAVAALDDVEGSNNASTETRARLREIEGMLAAAIVAEDAGNHPEERAEAAYARAMCIYRLGDLARASEAMVEASRLGYTPEQRERAMWAAIGALDAAIDAGAAGLDETRRRLAVAYLQSFPGGMRAARLLLAPDGESLVSSQEMIDVLAAVEPTSELYVLARRHLSRLLYREARRATGGERASWTARFLTVADDLVAREAATLRAASPSDAPQIAAGLVLRCRQSLDLILADEHPDVPRAARLLELLERTLPYVDDGGASLASEIAYRRLQIAFHAGEDARVAEALATLRSSSGRFRTAGDRFLFRNAVLRLAESRSDIGAARDAVEHGLALLGSLDGLDDSISDRGTAALADDVAFAAAIVWQAEADQSMLRTAVVLDGLLFDSGLASEDSVTRLARLAETDGDPQTALDAWLRLVAAGDPDESSWFEARHESLRLMLRLDPTTARVVARQHAALYPSLGPDPWGPRIAALMRRIDLLPGGGG